MPCLVYQWCLVSGFRILFDFQFYEFGKTCIRRGRNAFNVVLKDIYANATYDYSTPFYA
jgi:hypothetical protein